MEDNEFEEVTIISHTDLCPSVRSPANVESLIARIASTCSLDLVHRMSLTTTETLVDDPRLAPGLRELEKLKQDHFGEGDGKINEPTQNFFYISRVAGESGQYLLGAVESCILSNGQESKLLKDLGEPVMVVEKWGNYLFAFPYHRPIRIYDFTTLEMVQMTSLGSRCNASRAVIPTPSYLYFLTTSFKIGRIGKDLKDEEVDSKAALHDFFVCPKTETITTLERIGNVAHSCQLVRGDNALQMNTRFPLSELHILKKMYSDHFLVGVTNRAGRSQTVISLVDAQDLTMKTDHVLDRTNSFIKNIRLLAPRQGINCFLVAMVHSLELFCEYRLKLYHLKTLETPHDYSMALSWTIGDLWTLVCTQHTILSVRVDFSKCPALQL